MMRMASSKLPKGRHLMGDRDRLVYDIDVRLRGEEQPLLKPEVTVPITQNGSDPGLAVGSQIAVNKTYICYGLESGAIEVFNNKTSSTSLLKGLTQRVTHMGFFDEDVHLLASASIDGRVYVWKITEDPDEEDKPQITGKLVIAVQITGGGESVDPRICWHCNNQEVLVVGIGRHVLKIRTTKVGKRARFSAEEPLNCSTKKLIGGIQLVGSHDKEVTDLSICQRMTTCLVSASVDGTIKIWEDWKSQPIAVLQPHDGQPVNSATLLAAPDRPDHIILITYGGPPNLEVKIWVSASGEDWSAKSWRCTQTLELKSSEAPEEEAFLNQVVALSQAGLLLLANAKRNAIYAVHLEYGPIPQATCMDYIAEFTVKTPILSFTGTSELIPHGEQQVVKVYCVGTQAIEKYALDLSQCLPSPIVNVVSPHAASAEGLNVEPSISKQVGISISSSAPPKSVSVNETGVDSARYSVSPASTLPDIATVSGISSTSPPLPSSPRSSKTLSDEGIEMARESRDLLLNGRQIAVNKTYISYDLQLGGIEVLNIKTTMRSLLKGLCQRITDMAFFAEDVHLLASASIDGRVYVWKITEHLDEENKPQITGKLITAIQITGGGESVRPRVCWHCNKQEILIVGIGKHVLKIDTTKVGKGKRFLAEEPLRCSIEDLIIGSHDTEVTDLSMCQQRTTRLVSASVDGTIKIWEDQQSQLIAVLWPFDGGPVDLLRETNKVNEAGQFSGTDGTKTTAQDSSNEPGSSSSAPTESVIQPISSVQQLLNEVVSTQKEMQKQMATMADALWAWMQEENAEQDKEIQDLPVIIEKIVKRELAATARATTLQAQFQTPIIKKTIPTSITEKREAVQKYVNSKPKDTVARQNQVQFQTSGNEREQAAVLGQSVARSTTPINKKTILTSITEKWEAVQKYVNSKLKDTVARQNQGQFQTSGNQLRVGAGFINVHTSCYLNAVIQCLFHTEPFRDAILSRSYSNIPRGEWSILRDLNDLINKSFNSDIISPSSIIDRLEEIAPGFKRNFKQDAQEFLTFFLDKVESQSEGFTNMFRFRTQRECCGCRSTYSHASCCLLLRVSGEQKRLEEILQSYWNEEAVNARCEICKSDGPLFFLPEVGIFYLPPVDTKVVFPFEFNPDPFTSRQDDVVYSLYAVVVYRPKEKERVEHYYCYISVSPGQWFLFDDTEVKPVDTYVVRSARPYMLFYRKTTHSDSEEELSQKKDTQLNSELPDDIDYLAYIDYLYNEERTSENDWLFYIGIIMLLVVGFILVESLQFDERGERRERKK